MYSTHFEMRWIERVICLVLDMWECHQFLHSSRSCGLSDFAELHLDALRGFEPNFYVPGRYQLLAVFTCMAISTAFGALQLRTSASDVSDLVACLALHSRRHLKSNICVSLWFVELYSTSRLPFRGISLDFLQCAPNNSLDASTVPLPSVSGCNHHNLFN